MNSLEFIDAADPDNGVAALLKRQQEEIQLWAVHVEGPDDIIACADRAEADERAAGINAAYESFSKRPDASELDGRWHATVIPWPADWPAEDHAEEVARGDERWSP